MARSIPVLGADPPPDWPRTLHPRSIAVLGWARLSLGAREGSGYNLSASELAAGLAMSGHRVFYLRSGMYYATRAGMGLRRTEHWRGIECFELRNSPNLSPAAANFRNVRAELSHRGQTRLVLAWLDRVRAEIVHVHSLEGCPFDLIPAIRGTGRPVVVTPHNYWFVCPQVDLLHKEISLCRDFEGGRKCEGCLEAGEPRLLRLKRAAVQSAERLLGSGVVHWARWVAGMPARRREASREAGKRAVRLDPELSRGFDADPTADPRIVHDLGREPEPPLPLAPVLARDENERFLASDVHLKVLNGSIYGERRLAGVRALNAASLVIPPSDFLRRAHVAMGVEEARTRVVRLGQPHFDQIHRRAVRSPFYAERPWTARTTERPLRFAFLGVTRANKGLDVLVRAIEGLDPNVRRRCQVLIRAGGWDWPFRRRLAAYPEVQFAGGYDLIQLLAAAGEYDVGIVPHIWFENSPLVLLEHLHAGKFVITSRLGGPPEWIIEPGQSREYPLGNGLMVAGGDPADLASAMASLVRGEFELPSAREVHDATPHLVSYPDHVREIEGAYNGLLSRPGRGVGTLTSGALSAASPGPPSKMAPASGLG